MNSTVAIVGTHPATRDLAPYKNNEVDIWVFNNQAVQGWLPRATASFDMHHPNDINRRRIEHQPYNEWMKSSGVTIYTPFPIEDCPSNVVYPLDKICADLFPNFKRGERLNRYFTSGPAYALALAIHLGYKRIEFYGIEMESNSEYIYQRDGIGLMFGVAIGRGIEIVIPEKSMMFYSPLYGYEDEGTKIDREAFETRASELQIAMEQTFAQVNGAKANLDAIISKIDAARKAGKTKDIERIYGKDYETAQHHYELCIANHAFVNGQYLDCRNWQARVEKAMEFSGKAQELQGLNHSKWNRLVDKEELGIMKAGVE